MANNCLTPGPTPLEQVRNSEPPSHNASKQVDCQHAAKSICSQVDLTDFSSRELSCKASKVCLEPGGYAPGGLFGRSEARPEAVLGARKPVRSVWGASSLVRSPLGARRASCALGGLSGSLPGHQEARLEVVWGGPSGSHLGRKEARREAV